MFVANPDPFLLPAYRISPFRTEHITTNSALPFDNFANAYFDERFGAGKWQYTFNGREAIQLALENYHLEAHDVVTILTTSENFYISSCVTKTIETICQWNREILPETKLILVNHEFGYPHPEMERIVATGLPIVEDCCTTFFSQDAAEKVGKYGDFSVYSFPKFFPIQIGGLLVSNVKTLNDKSVVLEESQTEYIQNVVSYHLKNEAELLKKRKENLEYALAGFSKLGFTPRFQLEKNSVPSVLLLNNHDIIKDLNALKIFLANHGIQSSVFYGEDAFFIPNHQNLTYTDLDYFIHLISLFIHF